MKQQIERMEKGIKRSIVESVLTIFLLGFAGVSYIVASILLLSSVYHIFEGELVALAVFTVLCGGALALLFFLMNEIDLYIKGSNSHIKQLTKIVESLWRVRKDV